MRVLIIGGAGMIGRKLAARLVRDGQIGGQAIESLTLALGEDVDNARAHALLAICLVDRRRLAAAQHEAQAALRLAPQHWFSHLAAGKVHYAQRRPAQAEEHFKAAVELAPMTPGAQPYSSQSVSHAWIACGQALGSPTGSPLAKHTPTSTR